MVAVQWFSFVVVVILVGAAAFNFSTDLKFVVVLFFSFCSKSSISDVVDDVVVVVYDS